jgi:hypothetical protein
MGAHESLPHSQHVDSAFADADQNEVPDIAVAKGLPNSEREYIVQLASGNNPASFTEGNVYIKLGGKIGQTDWHLLNSGFPAFAEGRFSFRGRDIGEVDKVDVRVTSKNSLFVDHVKVGAMPAEQENGPANEAVPKDMKFFPINIWLGCRHEDTKWVGTAKEKEIDPGAMVGPEKAVKQASLACLAWPLRLAPGPSSRTRKAQLFL